jgi:hypothetical protein
LATAATSIKINAVHAVPVPRPVASNLPGVAR